jgi:mono/diheme cytochrome c family protein
MKPCASLADNLGSHMRSNLKTNRTNPLRQVLLWTVPILLCGATAHAQGSQSKKADHPSNRNEQGDVARGKYIVEGLSRCGQCHTPRESDGTPDRSHELQGAAVWLRSAEPQADWPLQAPRIAGIPPGTDAEMTKLLTTGIWRDGKPLRAPMPQFRMTQTDAEAVVAYLKSLQ